MTPNGLVCEARNIYILSRFAVGTDFGSLNDDLLVTVDIVSRKAYTADTQRWVHKVKMGLSI